ncbi:precursor of CEP9-like [Forsythia ovata]|uniref:Precursor of CEP9-like n=1 Tax=Forsythia ovata TaxID=205694 RepID=A0ABD1WQP4_9LAMI
MAYKHQSYIFVLLVAVIAFTEGRQLNAFKKQKQIIFPPNKSNYESSLTTSDADYKFLHDFRPTNPGNSPGIGHSFAAQNDVVQPKTPPFASGKNTDDFRPTGPGHSPGVGHYFEGPKA